MPDGRERRGNFGSGLPEHVWGRGLRGLGFRVQGLEFRRGFQSREDFEDVLRRSAKCGDQYLHMPPGRGSRLIGQSSGLIQKGVEGWFRGVHASSRPA